MALTTLLVVALVTVEAGGSQQAPVYLGRPVAEVLHEVQASGVRILFSSDLVPATLRVTVEPTSREPKRIALQILAPHALTLAPGPRGTLLVVAAPRPSHPKKPTSREPQKPQARDTNSGDPEPPREIPRIEEFVAVTDRMVEGNMGSTTYTLRPSTIRETAGGFENVFQVFQVLPGAAAINDEGGKLSVRGAGPEHNIVALDGVQIHNPYRFSELTSSFLNPETAATVALDASGLDASYGGRLSSVTTIETRDGRRDRRLAVSGSMGVANGNVLFEGPLPKSESGSWWLTARGTYYRPVVDLFRAGVLPSFADVQFKASLRPTKRTSLSMFALAGREAMEGGNQLDPGSGREFKGANRLALANLSWTPNSRLVTTTTLSGYAHSARDYDGGFGSVLDVFERNVRVQDLAVRQRAVFAISSRHVLDAGMDLHRMRSSWRMTGMKPPIFWRGIGPSTWGERVEYPPAGAIDSHLGRTQAGFWLQDRIPLGPRLSLEPGVRLDWNSFTRESIWQPRLRVAARFGRTAMWGGFAVQTQTPSHESLQGFEYFQLSDSAAPTLRNERSRQFVAGFERPLGAGLDLRVEAYRRRFDRLLVQRLETDAERAARLSSYVLPPDMPADSVLLEHRPTVHPESSGRGRAAGVEVLLQRNGERVSGWLGYTFSRTRREAYGFTFPFDFDRPHTLSAVANVQLASRVRWSTTVLRASGFAITPVHEEVLFAPIWNLDGTVEPIKRPSRNRVGALVMSPEPSMRRLSLRNSDRLSSYSRADVRVTYATLGRWEFYGEVINVFGSRNYLQLMPVPTIAGASDATATPLNVYEKFERFPTFGVRFKF
jgi:hypothetical protein